MEQYENVLMWIKSSFEEGTYVRIRTEQKQPSARQALRSAGHKHQAENPAQTKARTSLHAAENTSQKRVFHELSSSAIKKEIARLTDFVKKSFKIIM